MKQKTTIYFFICIFIAILCVKGGLYISCIKNLQHPAGFTLRPQLIFDAENFKEELINALWREGFKRDGKGVPAIKEQLNSLGFEIAKGDNEQMFEALSRHVNKFTDIPRDFRNRFLIAAEDITDNILQHVRQFGGIMLVRFDRKSGVIEGIVMDRGDGFIDGMYQHIYIQDAIFMRKGVMHGQALRDSLSQVDFLSIVTCEIDNDDKTTAYSWRKGDDKEKMLKYAPIEFGTKVHFGVYVRNSDPVRRLEKLIEFLTPSQQAAFILYYYEGLRGDKLASALGVSRTQTNNLVNDAKKIIQGNGEAKDIFREISEIDLTPDLRIRVMKHFSGVIQKEAERQKNESARGKVYNRRKANLSFLEIKEQDILKLSKRLVKGKARDLEKALRAYMVLTQKLKKIGINKGFNRFLDVISDSIVTGTKEEGIYRLLDRVNDRSLANPFLTDYRKEKGLSLKDIDKSEIATLLDKFPEGRTERNKVERVFKLYIAHVNLMKRLGINKGRVLSEDIISSFIEFVRYSDKATKKDIEKKMQMIFGKYVVRDIYNMFVGIENNPEITDIFAATPQEKSAFSKAFQKEFIICNFDLNLYMPRMTAVGQKPDLRASL